MKILTPPLRLATLLAALTLLPAATALHADPPVGIPAPSTPAAKKPQIDQAAIALLKKSQTAMLKPRSYRAECWTTETYDPSPKGKTHPTEYRMATFTAKKPNFMRYDSWFMHVDAQGRWSKSEEAPAFTFACNGRKQWLQFGSSYRIDTDVTPNDIRTDEEPWNGFYTPKDSLYQTLDDNKTQEELLEVRGDGRESVDGVICSRVFAHTKVIYEGEAQEYRTTWYIGPDALVRRQVQHVTIGDWGETIDAVLRRIQTNFPIANPKTLFAYVPPKGVESEAQHRAKAPKLLAKGTVAPAFPAVDKNGAAVKLSDLRGKIVVIDFWASWCGPCNESMPHAQAVTKKLQAANVPLILLAVDNGEAKPAFAQWVEAHPELDALRFVYADRKTGDVCGKSYHVSGIPTQYVIDAQGIIRACFVGYGGPTDDLEKAVRAAAEPLR